MIAKRYIDAMKRNPPEMRASDAPEPASAASGPDAELAADLIVHLARIARSGEDSGEAKGRNPVQRLSAAQWAALRYMARANPFSRTPSAFARYHGTTRGTASQTIKSLVAAGLLTRARDDRDRRSVRFALTASGEACLAEDGACALAQAVADLPADQRENLIATMRRLAGEIAVSHGAPCFGCCQDCRHLRERDACAGYCAQVDAPLSLDDMHLLCADFEAAVERG
jgi:DNA-binding MarR family transcriptional regulator